MLPLQESQVRSLVRKLGSHIPQPKKTRRLSSAPPSFYKKMSEFRRSGRTRLLLQITATRVTPSRCGARHVQAEPRCCHLLIPHKSFVKCPYQPTSPQRLSPLPAAVESTGAPVGGSPHSWWKCRECSFEETGWFIYGRILWADWIPRVDARFFSPQIAAQERGCHLIRGVFTEAQFIWSTLVSQLQWHEGHMAALLKRNQ